MSTPAPGNSALIPDFSCLLLAWFEQNGRKDLPWQKNKTPYRVWLSEIMLQQTQVNTVIPYYLRFLKTFPTMNALANASLDEVLHLWAGLGYYSRARNLHKTAQLIYHEMQGQFPNTLEGLVAMPGIGLSTAGAIRAIAFNQPTPILDGNVKRVLARVAGIKSPINEKETEQHLWQLAKQYMPPTRAADYTQAIMDIGATICTPRKPLCATCPLQKQCCAFTQGLQEQLPLKRPNKAKPTREAIFLILRYRSEIFLLKRPTKGIWGGLWCLPEFNKMTPADALKAFRKQFFAIGAAKTHPLPAFKHSFTHYHLFLYPVLVELKGKGRKHLVKTNEIWYNMQQPVSLGVPKPIQDILDAL